MFYAEPADELAAMNASTEAQIPRPLRRGPGADAGPVARAAPRNEHAERSGRRLPRRSPGAFKHFVRWLALDADRARSLESVVRTKGASPPMPTPMLRLMLMLMLMLVLMLVLMLFENSKYSIV